MWDTVIGLETHVQLSTKSKIFSPVSTDFNTEPNSQVNFIDAGLPGVLPVVNQNVVEKAIKFGLAVNAEIASTSIFARKNYFYPDLPKGYQISQFELPIVVGGILEARRKNGTVFKVKLVRAHLEEDAGKSIHEGVEGLPDKFSGIDLNRAGMPLLEIVTEPCMHSAEDAVAYAKTLHQLVTWIDICDGNMQEGSFRIDANVSIKKKSSEKLGTRCEIKNLNSFKFLERAINVEIDRQIDLIENGQPVIQQTRLFDPNKDETRAMRSKEDANDYRYFPDPDLPKLIVEKNLIAEIKENIPEMPSVLKTRFSDLFELNSESCDALTSNKLIADFFVNTLDLFCKFGKQKSSLQEKNKLTSSRAKLVANWMLGDLFYTLNRENLEIDQTKISPDTMANFLMKLEDGTLSNKTAKELFVILWNNDSEKSVNELIESSGLFQIKNNDQISEFVLEVLAKNSDMVKQILQGKEKALNSLVGQVMKISKGKANPKIVREVLLEKIKKI